MKTLDPVFREKKKSNENIETYFSEEAENDNEFGARIIKLFNKENNELIGNISFDYDIDKMIKVRFVGVDDKYKRNDLSLELYKHLIELSKNKNLDGIKSDQVVQGGALASWKKLKESGFDLSVYPELQNKFDEFCKTYDEGKYYKESLSAPNSESVFTINLVDKNPS